MTGILRKPRLAALAAIALLVAAASVASFAQSYRGLYLWAARHGLTGAWAVIWPLQVDTFIAVGELALFVALVDRWERRSRIGAWMVTGTGVLVSVAGNVGHAPTHDLASRATFAVPPLAAAVALAAGLAVLKRVVEHHHESTGDATAGATAKARARATARPPAKSSASGLDAAAKAAIEATRQGQPVPSARELARTYHIGRDKAGEVRTAALAGSNGHGGGDPS